MSKFTIREAEDGLAVDKNNLHENNIRHPQLVWEVSREHARANARVRELTRDKANLGAQMDRKIREAATKLDGKITEKSIEMTVRDSSEMRDVNAELLAAQEQVDLWSGMMEACRERGRSMREAGELYRSNYFATDSSGTSQEGRDERKRVADAVRSQVKRPERIRRERDDA